MSQLLSTKAEVQRTIILPGEQTVATLVPRCTLIYAAVAHAIVWIAILIQILNIARLPVCFLFDLVTFVKESSTISGLFNKYFTPRSCAVTGTDKASIKLDNTEKVRRNQTIIN